MKQGLNYSLSVTTFILFQNVNNNFSNTDFYFYLVVLALFIENYILVQILVQIRLDDEVKI